MRLSDAIDARFNVYRNGALMSRPRPWTAADVPHQLRGLLEPMQQILDGAEGRIPLVAGTVTWEIERA